MVGYGLTGTGATGDILPYGTKHSGENKFEGDSGLFGFYPDELIYDFDSGLAANDAFGQLFGINDLGVGINEASAAPGDSGGPCLVGGVIVGVTSYGVSVLGSWDAVPGINASFGDMDAAVNVALYADWIDSVTLGGGPEFLVNQTIAGDQKWSSVAMDADGDFVITWTSYGQDGTGNGPGPGVNGENGIYVRRYDAKGTAVSDEFRANTFTYNDQQYSRVAMNEAGDFTVVWESYQDRAGGGGINSSDTPNTFGIYGQSYVRNSLVGVAPYTGVHGEFQSEFQVNSTQDGDQRFPSIAMDDNGDFLVVWSGLGDRAGQADTQGVFMKRFDKTADTIGPRVLEVFNGSSSGREIMDNDILPVQSTPTQITVVFSEDLLGNASNNPNYNPAIDGPNGPHSVLNLNNWNLTLNGVAIPRGVYQVTSFARRSDGKYEATLILDGNPLTAGADALGEGVYVLTARSAIQDKSGNALDGNLDGTPGGDFHIAFTVGTAGSGIVIPGPGTPSAGSSDGMVNATQTGYEDTPAVARNAKGDYVVVWLSYGQVTGQRYNNVGQAVGGEFTVNTYTSSFWPQSSPAVAIDGFGNFVVTWSSTDVNGMTSVFARMFDAFGTPVGAEFQVTPVMTTVQQQPSVAMNADGSFVITWTRYNQSGNKNGNIIGRFYNSYGQPVGAEFQVSTTQTRSNEFSNVAMADNGSIVVTWQSFSATADNWDIFAQRIDAAGRKIGGEFRVNSFTTDMQTSPQVSMDAAGDFVIVWQSYTQDGSDYGVYGRRYNAAGSALDASEFRVNQTTLNRQYQPDVAMDASGNFTVVWTAFGQDDVIYKDYGIFARMYRADGSTQMGEFRVNAMTAGNQVTPVVARGAANGSAIVVWCGYDYYGTEIYSRLIGGIAPAAQAAQANAAGMTADFNSDTISDVLWYNLSTGNVGAWIISNTTYAAWAALGSADPKQWTVIGSGDFNGDGVADILWQNKSTGLVGAWIIKNGTYTTWAGLGNADPNIWSIAGIGDFNGDGVADVLWQNKSNGAVGAWLIKNGVYTAWANLGGADPKVWTIAGVGDFNGDGTADVLWQNKSTGAVGAWIIKNGTYSAWANLGGADPKAWTIAGVGDFNGDGTADVLWQNKSTGIVGAWIVNGGVYTSWANLGGADPKVWAIAGIGDFSGDGTTDVLWQNKSTGNVGAWIVNSGTYVRWAAFGGADPKQWTTVVASGQKTQALLADNMIASPAAAAAALSARDLQAIVNAAIANWAATGLDAATIRQLSQVQFVVADLSGSLLGEASGNTIYIDSNAAGHGWFVDSTPLRNEEFLSLSGQLRAIDPRAVDRIDLLTVVEHELGHLAGLDDLDALSNDLMSGVLAAGLRRAPA